MCEVPTFGACEDCLHEVEEIRKLRFIRVVLRDFWGMSCFDSFQHCLFQCPTLKGNLFCSLEELTRMSQLGFRGVLIPCVYHYISGNFSLIKRELRLA